MILTSAFVVPFNRTGYATDNVILLGDFNSYSAEPPITEIKKNGYVPLKDGKYSYVYSGQWGKLDHAFIKEEAFLGLSGMEAALWNCNADELDLIDYNLDYGRNPSLFDPSIPERFSDHDPVVLGLDFTCADGDGKFFTKLNNKGRNCKWLLESNEKAKHQFCGMTEGKDGLPTARELCKKTCRVCPFCADGFGTFRFPTKQSTKKGNCYNLANKMAPGKRLKLCSLTEGIDGFFLPREVCPGTCGVCPNSCTDKPGKFAFENEEGKLVRKTCSWLFKADYGTQSIACSAEEGSRKLPPPRELCPHLCEACPS